MNDVAWKRKNRTQKKEKTSILGYGGSFTYYTEKIFDLIALSLLWLVCSIPVITIGASSTALYYGMNKAWKQEGSYITKEFYHAFRINLKQSTMLWSALAVVSFILQLNLGIVGAKMSGNIQIFFFLMYGLALFFWTGVQIYAFPALSRFDMPVGWIIKLSIYLCFRHIGKTILLMAMTFAAIAAVYYFLPTVLLLPALVNYGYSYLLEPVLKNHMPTAKV
ncbi:MAG: DUF624 domain-containing protein [Lachnospiraceae bacterium]|nr:DUF624 domain-containing protein [Lachnospiraceae bacterium]